MVYLPPFFTTWGKFVGCHLAYLEKEHNSANPMGLLRILRVNVSKIFRTNSVNEEVVLYLSTGEDLAFPIPVANIQQIWN